MGSGLSSICVRGQSEEREQNETQDALQGMFRSVQRSGEQDAEANAVPVFVDEVRGK